MAFFGTFKFGEALFGTGGITPQDDFIRVPWTFQEVYDPDIYEFAVNPLDAEMPSIQKTIVERKTSAGRSIIFQGRDQVQTLSFSGTILTELHFRKMEEWFLKEKQINLKDDLGRSYWIYLTSFTPARQPSTDYPWRHEYSAESIVLSWS